MRDGFSILILLVLGLLVTLAGFVFHRLLGLLAGKAFALVESGQGVFIQLGMSPEHVAYLAAKRTSTLCLQKSVHLLVAGETTTFKVDSWKEGFLSQALTKTEARSVLRSSSDLSVILAV